MAIKTKMVNKFKARRWQRDAFTVIDNYKDGVVPVNACVGSGKTVVACYALGKFIVDNKDNKTVQLFVTPRIRLCDQQNKEIETFLESEFNLKNGVNYAIVGVDCTKHQYNKKNDSLVSKHTIFVICDKSLWGKTKGVNPVARWQSWLRKFKKWQNAKFKFGWAALDEAHNYANNEKLMFNNKDDKEPCLANWFRLMPMSGTPAAFQKEWTEKWAMNVCKCSPKEAMKNEWICTPNLNLVLGDKERGWARAIAAVFNREVFICKNEVFKPRLMVNCPGRDVINELVRLEWMQAHVGKDFHFITLLSIKDYVDDDGVLAFIEPTIDCKVVDADEAYKAIEAIDSNSYFKDDLPIIVAQVAMLGEGINVSSFNAILTASNADTTAMQQIGRCIRNYRLNGKEKVHHGHANVYVLTDNELSIKNLLLNLKEYELTHECFRWGDKIDIMSGSGPEDRDDTVVPLTTFKWDPIDPDHDLAIIEMMSSVDKKWGKNVSRNLVNSLFKDNDGDGKADIEELYPLLESLSKRGMTKLWSSHSFSNHEITNGRKERVKENKAKTAKKDSKASKKFETKRSNPVYDLVMKWLIDIQHCVHSSESTKELWNLDRTMCIDTILQNEEVAEYLVNHLNLDNIIK